MKNKKNLLIILLIVIIIILILIYFLFLRTKSFIVTFDTNGGSSIKEIIVEKGKNVKLPVPPKKEGYVFAGWLLPNDEVVTKDTIINGNITLKSKWKLQYVCPENCTPSEDGSTCTREVTISLTKTTSCPSGYTKENDICKKIETVNCTIAKN